MLSNAETANFEFFRDCLSTLLIQKYAVDKTKKTQKRKNGRKYENVASSVSLEQEEGRDAEDLADFADYIATEIFTCLPTDLRSLTYSTYKNSPVLQTQYSFPLTLSTTTNILATQLPSTTETLTTYHLLPPSTPSLPSFLHPLLTTYLTHYTTPPPPPSSTKALATACEICDRDWIPLTYHHLIPRSVHKKAIKRNWGKEEDGEGKERLERVAWLCRQCHSFIHRVCGNDELAREYFSVGRLLEREDVGRWRGWVGRVRWGAR